MSEIWIIKVATVYCRPQCDRACDPENVKPKSLVLVQFGAQIAAALPLRKVYEVFALLHPVHSIIRQHGLTAMASLKAGVKALEEGSESGDLKAGEAVDRAVQSSLALVTLLMLSNVLSGKFGMRADKLAALENSADCRKKERNKEVQVKICSPTVSTAGWVVAISKRLLQREAKACQGSKTKTCLASYI